MLHEAIKALLETLYMVFTSGVIAALLGIPLGLVLWITEPKNICAMPWLHNPLVIIVNALRSIPFIILMIILIPVTRWVIGTSIGTSATIIPLSIAATPFIARLAEDTFQHVQIGLIDAALSMGASSFQLIWKIVIPETLPSLINNITVTLVNLVGYSAMAGTIGGGGLGSLAIHYGYQRFDVSVMISTVLILILLVHTIQYLGDSIANQLRSNIGG